VCTPLTGDSAWLVTDDDLSGVAALQELGPVCLAEPHGPVRSACVIGDRIVWDSAPPSDVVDLAPRLLRLADAAGLVSLEIAIAPVRRGQAVVRVEPLVLLEHFQAPQRDGILDGLVELLSGEVTCVRQSLETPA
jgi:hypothetical protein